MEAYERWESIRTNWVNGNLEDAKAKLYIMPKLEMLNTIRAALSYSYDLNHEDGTIVDLLEILNSMARDYNNNK